MHADDVAGNQFLLGITEGFVGRRLHGRIQSFHGYGFGIILQRGVQNRDGTGSNRYTLGGTDHLSCQLRDHQSDGLCRTGLRRNDIHGRCPGSAEISFLVRSVQNHLIAGIRMDGGHEAGAQFSVIVQGLRHRRQAVGGAAGTGNDAVFRRQCLVVDVVYDGRKVVPCRCGNQNFLRTRIQMGLGLRLAGEESGAFQHHINSQIPPRQIVRIRLLVNPDFLLPYIDI